jgi:hypothetical protein
MEKQQHISKQVIRQDLVETRLMFHNLHDSFSEDGLRKSSHNPGWTNGEILFHMAFGFFLLPTLIPMVRFFGRLPKNVSKPLALVLNASTGLFNGINAIGPRAGGRFFCGASLGKAYDWANGRILHLLDAIEDDEWQRGMYYPQKWDSLFHEYMTLEQLFYYPIEHLRFHVKQLAR